MLLSSKHWAVQARHLQLNKSVVRFGSGKTHWSCTSVAVSILSPKWLLHLSNPAQLH